MEYAQERQIHRSILKLDVTSTMSLSYLPSELVLYVLQASNHFADALSLTGTSRQIYDVWKPNARSICHAILPRVIGYFSRAVEAPEAQHYFESYNNPDFRRLQTRKEAAIK